MLIVQDDDEREDEEETENTEESEVKVIEATNNVEIALRSIVGFSGKGTMKLKALVAGREVVVMVDCGATHNFIHQKLVTELELPLMQTSNYGIVVGNGNAF